MNYLVIAIIALLIWSIFDGYRKGFMKTVFALVSWILVLVLCNVATPMVTEFLVEETGLVDSISGAISEKLDEVIAESGVTEFEEGLPEELKAALLGENGNLEEIIASNGEMVINSTSIVYTIISVIAFILVVVVTRVAMLVLDVILGIASKLPIIGPMDKLLGLLCGGVKGLLISWLVLAVITVLAYTGTNAEWMVYISESQLLSWLQENNFILKMLVAGQ